ncbi:MAG: O-acetyl-ADP-ribose deacetylase, partial [Cutibacterium acnes]
MEDAARIAVETCHAMADEVGGTVDEVLFVPYGETAEAAFRTVLDRVERD